MPYTKTGYIRVPRSRYIPQHCRDIMEHFGATLDTDISDVIKSLGHDRDRLQSLILPNVFTITTPKLEANPDIKFKFMVVLIDFLNMTGYLNENITLVDYVTDPVLSADTLLDLMIGSRMPKFEAAELNGEWGMISTLRAYMPEVIRHTAVITQERKLMANRFREWIGNIGFKLLTGKSDKLSQAERSFLVVYGCTKPNTKGFIEGLPSNPIPPVENKFPLIEEVGQLAVASCLSGPCTNHLKLVSNAILQNCVYYYGPHIPEIKTQVGYVENRGPFIIFKMMAGDTIPWDIKHQITGLNAQAATITIAPDKMPPFTIIQPLPLIEISKSGAISLYEDLPELNLYLTDQNNVNKFFWDFPSNWQGRRLSSLNDGITIDIMLADVATHKALGGGMQVESTDLTSFGLSWFTDAAKAQIRTGEEEADQSGYFIEKFILPSPKGLILKPIDLTAHYAVLGKWEVLSPFAEYLEVATPWFLTPDDGVHQFVATSQGLTLEAQVRFKTVIALCHNVARYERITKRQCPLRWQDLARALLNRPSTEIITPA